MAERLIGLGAAATEAGQLAGEAVEAIVFLQAAAGEGLLEDDPTGRLGRGGTARLNDLVGRSGARLGPGLFSLDDSPPRWLAGPLGNVPLDDAWLGRLAQSVPQIDPPTIPSWAHQQLLGCRLEATAGGLAVRREPGGRKDAGAFYTPPAVSEYIVRRCLEGTGRAEGSPAGILDPACGAGAFLLPALRELSTGEQDAMAVLAQLHGFDLDGQAVLAARRALWLEVFLHGDRSLRALETDGPRVAAELAANIRCRDVLADDVGAAEAGRYDVVLGNPPYRRERGAKPLLDRLAQSELGRRFRAARMDLWFYFLHRGLELLDDGGRLGFIVNAYWTRGRSSAVLRDALRQTAGLEEIFLLDDLPVFDGVAGRHLILLAVKGSGPGRTTIKRPAAGTGASRELAALLAGDGPLAVYAKTAEQLFRPDGLDLEEPCEELLAAIGRHEPLGRLGAVRQGIAENPAAVNRRTNERFGNRWTVGEGVFVLTDDELARLDLPDEERAVLRPYHALSDLGRYYLAAPPSRTLIYSTAETWPQAECFPVLRRHLERFRAVLESRRETRLGLRGWWQLHWPREEGLWRRPKLLAVQMGARPAFAAAREPAYVSFSVNVFAPGPGVGEHLHYFAAVLNSRLAWVWFQNRAKRRGVGLEINGHVLAGFPLRRIDFANPVDKVRHDRLVELAGRIAALAGPRRDAAARAESERLDQSIDPLVYEIYGLTAAQAAAVESRTRMVSHARG